MADPARHDTNSTPGYELRDISVAPVLGAGIAIVATLLVFSALMWVMYMAVADKVASFSDPAHPMAPTQARSEPPSPRLQAHPVDDLTALRVWEDGKLEGYAWVDKSTGVVQLPIERAMELTVERGLPSSGGGGR